MPWNFMTFDHFSLLLQEFIPYIWRSRWFHWQKLWSLLNDPRVRSEEKQALSNEDKVPSWKKHWMGAEWVRTHPRLATLVALECLVQFYREVFRWENNKFLVVSVGSVCVPTTKCNISCLPSMSFYKLYLKSLCNLSYFNRFTWYFKTSRLNYYDTLIILFS